MITDHPFKRCFFMDTLARAVSCEGISLCVCPYGMFRCHVRGCGKKRSEHERCCDGTDASCPVHGTDRQLTEYTPSYER